MLPFQCEYGGLYSVALNEQCLMLLSETFECHLLYKYFAWVQNLKQVLYVQRQC